jgi:hypothetical protein
MPYECKGSEWSDCFPERYICNLNAECYHSADERDCNDTYG